MDEAVGDGKGASIRGCMQCGPSGGPIGFSPFFFLGCQGNSVNDTAYLLGLSDDDPHRIVIRKGMVSTGSLAGGGSVTFSNRFPAAPSSITFSSLNQASGFSGNPSTYFADRDGFGFYSYQTIPALGTVW